MSGSAKDGTYEAVVTLPQRTPAGTWTLSHASVTDGVGNTRSSAPSATITQVGAGDAEAPVVHSVTPLTDTSVDTCTGAATVRFELRITDATGVTGGWMLFRSPLAEVGGLYGSVRRIGGTATDGTFEVAVTVPQNAAATTWTLASGTVHDAMGNSGRFQSPVSITNGPRVPAGDGSAA